MFSKDSLHHAYFIEGEKSLIILDIESFLKDAFQIERRGNPDVHFAEYESFGIDESRALQEMQIMRPVTGDKKIFILVANSIANEAQNALLKVFEEPTPGTHFFVISSSQRILLPTLRSRMVVLVHPSSREDKSNASAAKFIKMSLKNRLAFVADLIEEKDKAKVEVFLQALLSELSKDGLEKANKKRTESIKEILSLTKYLKDRAPSLKLILERVALLNF